ncbi:MAG TPA: hypothetical protein VIM11_05520 [Tepidisphaeraceae bacterium]
MQINLEPQNIFTFQRASLFQKFGRDKNVCPTADQKIPPSAGESADAKNKAAADWSELTTLLLQIFDFESHHRMAATLKAGAGITAGSNNGLSV